MVQRLQRLDEILGALPGADQTKELVMDPKKPTAVMLVGGFSGLGIHSLLTVMRLFPRYYSQRGFMGVGVVDRATFQGVEEVDRVRAQTETGLEKYVALAHRLGIPAEIADERGHRSGGRVHAAGDRGGQGVPAGDVLRRQADLRAREVVHRLLHNETAYTIQRRLQFAGLAMVILPVRVLE